MDSSEEEEDFEGSDDSVFWSERILLLTEIFQLRDTEQSLLNVVRETYIQIFWRILFCSFYDGVFCRKTCTKGRRWWNYCALLGNPDNVSDQTSKLCLSPTENVCRISSGRFDFRSVRKTHLLAFEVKRTMHSLHSCVISDFLLRCLWDRREVVF